MNTYKIFWNNEAATIKAKTSYSASIKAVKIFQNCTRKKVKSHDIQVILMVKGDKEIFTSTQFV